MPTYHYIPKRISEIKASDIKVSILGVVSDVYKNSFVLSDDTGKIEIACENDAEKGRVVRVFCSVADEKLKADFVQNMEGLDLDLFKKINSLYNSSGV
ncbi:MAG: hypothetical protein HYW23_00275 [Candidatus Aenigmarchaeota archaeon]|nr:hypothetical protein [Candidatus Aenigmarchaeota archaeon]